MAGFGLNRKRLEKEDPPHKVGEDALTGEKPLIARNLPVAFGRE